MKSHKYFLFKGLVKIFANKCPLKIILFFSLLFRPPMPSGWAEVISLLFSLKRIRARFNTITKQIIIQATIMFEFLLQFCTLQF